MQLWDQIWGGGQRGQRDGGGPSQLGTGYKIWGRAELGWDTAMRWRNVTHAVNELPVCLPKWRLHENASGHPHLGWITKPLPSAPTAACWLSEMSSVWWGGRVFSWGQPRPPSHSSISSNTHSWAINKCGGLPSEIQQGTTKLQQTWRTTPRHKPLNSGEAEGGWQLNKLIWGGGFSF